MSGSSNFNVGRDVSVVVITSTGARLDLTGMIEFAWKPKQNMITHEPLSVPPQMRALPAGHDLTMTIERLNGANEALFSQIEQGYWAGGYPNGTTGGGTLYYYIKETTGAQSTTEFSNVSLWMTDGGTSSAKSALKQTINGFGSTGLKVA